MSSFVIFSIDHVHTFAQWKRFESFINTATADGHIKGNVIRCVGKYAGVKEDCWIVSKDDFDRVIRGSFYMIGQESILHVASGNKMECWLEYLNDDSRADEPLGHMHAVCEEEARVSDAFTYRPDLGNYYVAKQGNPDNSYAESVAKYRTHKAIAAE